MKMKKCIMTMVLGALMACLVPANAQTAQQTKIQAQSQEWQSTSSLRESGSAYSPQVNAVGAPAAPYIATTTASENTDQPTHPGRPRRSKDDPGELDWTIDEGSPVGDAMLPLLLMALAFTGVIAFRRRFATKR